MHTKDGNIVHQCLSGNTELFALLVDKYKERIFALVYAKVGQFQDAEDITQEVFLEAYRKLSTLRRWDSFYPWLYSIASNQCKNYHYDRKRRVDMTLFDDPADIHQADMDAHAEKLRNEQIHEALDSLPEIHRQVLVLRYMAGMRSKEIAQTLRVSPNTVNQRLMRARTQMKAVLNEEMIPMIPNAFAERKLQPGFTGRIIELIKGTQIQTAPHKTALPLGLSAAGGVIILLLSLGIPQSPLYPVGEWLGGPLPLKTQAFENGELAVDAEATEVTMLGGEQVDGGFGQKPERRELPTNEGQLDESQKKDMLPKVVHLPDDVGPGTELDFSPDGREMVYFSIGSPPTPGGLIVRPVVSGSSDVTLQPTVLVNEGDPTFYYQPKWSPDGRWIAFYRHSPSTGRSPGSGEDMDVCLIPASGGKMRFLAQTGSNKCPEGLSWSPDGKELAFERWNGENADIFIVSVATRKTRPFTTDGKANLNPVWSGDGKWLTYMSRRGVGIGRRRWVQALDGGKPRILEDFELNPLVYSTDGRWVAYFHFQPKLDQPTGFYAARVNVQGEFSQEPVFLKAVLSDSDMFGRPMRWTSREEVIIAEEYFNSKTYALSLKSGEVRPVKVAPSLLYQPEPLQWLVDGRHLCLPSGDGRQSRLLNVETGESRTVAISPSEGTQLGASTFSPDGTRIAFVRYEKKKNPQVSGNTGNYKKATLYIMPVAGESPRKLINGDFHVRNPRWSPNGDEIAFFNVKIREPGNLKKAELCVVTVASGHVRRLTTDLGLLMGPVWSPDGETLAFLRLNDEGKFSDWVEMEGDLYVVSAAGGTPKQITYTPEHELEFAWTPDGTRLRFRVSKDPRREHWTVSINDGELTKLRENYIRSSWSSDGKSYLASADLGTFQRVSLDGFTSSELSVSIPVTGGPLCMSPNGEVILFSQGDSNTQWWIIDVSHLASQ